MVHVQYTNQKAAYAEPVALIGLAVFAFFLGGIRRKRGWIRQRGVAARALLTSCGLVCADKSHVQPADRPACVGDSGRIALNFP
ncbi:hypothetical protein PENSPDRAFT_274391 [Peniophora sp. CONT]|nr:hypothetical protein PENSPDRAFT_274391 [Peniophora sp. CONT]